MESGGVESVRAESVRGGECKIVSVRGGECEG